MATVASTITLAEDEQRLKYALTMVANVSPRGTSAYEASAAFIALDVIGVKTWSDFISIAERDLENLTWKSIVDHQIYKVPSVINRKLIILLAFHHHHSRLLMRPVDITTCTALDFDDFRVMTYDFSQPIRAWMNPSSTLKNDELSNWTRNVRPMAKDYPFFKDDHKWIQTLDRFESTAKAHRLSHILDPTFVPTNTDLDNAQQEWMYKVFQDCMQTSKAKSIVTDYLISKDVRECWKKIKDHYSKSMATQIRSGTISSYISSTRLKDINWRGTQNSYLAHFKEQCRLFNEIAIDRFSDGQLIQFLHQSLAGIQNLSGILTQDQATRIAAGNTDKLSFEEYYQLLMASADVQDNTNTSTKNPRSQRSANSHEIILDDGEVIEFFNPGSYEVNVHDHSTTIEDYDVDTDISTILVNSAQQDPSASSGRQEGRRRAMMNKQTWDSLSKGDQAAWDQMTEEGKQAVLKYVQERERRAAANSSSGLQSRRPGPDQDNRFQASTHNVETTQETEDTSSDTKTLSASTHEQTPSKPRDLLHMATHRSTTLQKGYDVRTHLSKSLAKSSDTTKETTFRVGHHETVPNAKYTSNVHKWRNPRFSHEDADPEPDPPANVPSAEYLAFLQAEAEECAQLELTGTHVPDQGHAERAYHSWSRTEYIDDDLFTSRRSNTVQRSSIQAEQCARAIVSEQAGEILEYTNAIAATVGSDPNAPQSKDDFARITAHQSHTDTDELTSRFGQLKTDDPHITIRKDTTFIVDSGANRHATSDQYTAGGHFIGHDLTRIQRTTPSMTDRPRQLPSPYQATQDAITALPYSGSYYAPSTASDPNLIGIDQRTDKGTPYALSENAVENKYESEHEEESNQEYESETETASDPHEDDEDMPPLEEVSTDNVDPPKDEEQPSSSLSEHDDVSVTQPDTKTPDTVKDTPAENITQLPSSDTKTYADATTDVVSSQETSTASHSDQSSDAPHKNLRPATKTTTVRSASKATTTQDVTQGIGRAKLNPGRGQHTAGRGFGRGGRAGRAPAGRAPYRGNQYAVLSGEGNSPKNATTPRGTPTFSKPTASSAAKNTPPKGTTTTSDTPASAKSPDWHKKESKKEDKKKRPKGDTPKKKDFRKGNRR